MIVAEHFPVKTILSWFEKEMRPFAWRQSERDPYETYVVEIMSQQSTMNSVVRYHSEWMLKLPTIEDLAKAQESTVMKLWAGLGYYRRAKNIRLAAKEIVAFKKKYKRWPQTKEEWLQFPGIGNYTAATIASLAFDEPVVGVDGNVLRVLSRYLAVKDPLNKTTDRAHVDNFIDALATKIPKGKRGHFAESLIELGATLCLPKNRAICALCPLKEKCLSAGNEKYLSLYPKKKDRRDVKKVFIDYVFIQDSRGAILVKKIARGRRLEGQFEFPTIKGGAVKSAILAGPIRHSITHHRITARLLKGRKRKAGPGEEYRKLSKALPLTTLCRKLLSAL